MFDLPGLKAMGESIETFTTETHAGLLDIAMQLRINNALLAMNQADRPEDGSTGGGTTPLEILRMATQLAGAFNDATTDGGGDET